VGARISNAGTSRRNKCGQANNAKSRGFSITADKTIQIRRQKVTEIELRGGDSIVNSTSAEHARADVPVVFPLIYIYLDIKATQLMKTRIEQIVQA
jgi:hypothetical protein